MKLISKIFVDHFRSIRQTEIESLGNFTAFAGLNNAGKSNILRALNTFFTGYTDSDLIIEYKRDYYRKDLASKKRRKSISICIEFNLPDSFQFRKKLEPVEELLGRNFKLTKTWKPDLLLPQYFLRDSTTELDLADREKVEQFLGLINFRYIPNRVLPIDVIKKEHKALRDTLVRRLARRIKTEKELFAAISDTSSSLIKTLQHSVRDACPEIGGIRLDTPASWQDLIFAFGYKLASGKVEIEDYAQGSGIQSLLMLETLSLIDRDYYQQFGWKQATIWAIEEPESSLHTSLEAKIANYLLNISQDTKSRLQILSTTHSDLILQNADCTFFVTSGNKGSFFEMCDKKKVLLESAKLGISRYSHPILSHPLDPVILVEGKYDFDFMDKAFKILYPNREFIVSYLEQLDERHSGGDGVLLEYLKNNISVISLRTKESPIIVVPDWDSNLKQKYKNLCNDGIPLHVVDWPESAFNPKLTDGFKGIERCVSERIIREADRDIKVIGDTQDDKITVGAKNFNSKLKPEINRIINQGIRSEDLVHITPLCAEIKRLIDETLV